MQLYALNDNFPVKKDLNKSFILSSNFESKSMPEIEPITVLVQVYVEVEL